jgi:hypothetical protein
VAILVQRVYGRFPPTPQPTADIVHHPLPCSHLFSLIRTIPLVLFQPPQLSSIIQASEKQKQSFNPSDSLVLIEDCVYIIRITDSFKFAMVWTHRSFASFDFRLV